ncbi:MAG: mechanosensitive ion channel [Alphaproteobacteria bacterium]|nr:mechanosensitive ion channel [Alphaproteobacteria bacterium]
MMSKLLHVFMISLILLINQDFAYGARVQSLSKDDDNSAISLSETSKNDDKEKKTEEKIDKKAQENQEQIKLMSPSEIHQKVKSIDWVSWIIKFFRIFIIIMVARAVWKVLRIAIQKHLNKLLVFHRKQGVDAETSPLFKTIIPIIESIMHWALIILTTLIVLSDLGVDITPIVLSFSVVGLAFSFGSQELVKDLINGVLTLFDGNISVGDFVKVGGSNGVVESISLRAIILRHSTGELQTIPFSEAKSVINCSRNFNNAEFLVAISPESNMDDVHGAFSSVYEDLKNDDKFGSCILEELSDIGVQSMTVSGIVVLASLKVKPDPEKVFSFEFNRRLFIELQKRKVPFAYNPSLYGEIKKEG